MSERVTNVIPARTVLAPILLALTPAWRQARDLPPAPRCPIYDLGCRIDPEEHRLEVEGSVRLAAGERDALTFTLRKDMSDLAFEVSAPAVCAGPAELRRVASDREGNTWELRPRSPFPAEAELELAFHYEGGQTHTLNFYLGPEGCTALTPTWCPIFQGSRGTGRMRFVVPKGYVVRASGVQIAAEEGDPESTFAFRIDQPMLPSFAAGRYVVVPGAGAVPITFYLFNERPFLPEFVAGCARVLEVLQDEYGPYPYGEFALVEMPPPQAKEQGVGGASFQGMISIATSFLDKGFNLGFFAHELAHQWWGNLVQLEGERGDFMTDEALAEYSVLLCAERLEGPASARRVRRIGYPAYAEPLGGARGYFLWATAGFDHPLGSLPSDFLWYALSDMKGPLVYHMLAREVGPERFRKALRLITSEHAFGDITWEGFLHDLERGTERDLGWFFDQWFERTGAPRWTTEWHQEGDRVAVEITQPAPPYRLRLPVRIEFADGTATMQEALIDGESSRMDFSAPGRVRAVAVDPDGEVLHWTPELEEEARVFRNWTIGKRHRAQDEFAQALPSYLQALAELPEVDVYGLEFATRLELAAIHREQGRLDEARAEYERAFGCAVRLPEMLPEAYLELAEIAREQSDAALAERMVHQARAAEVETGVRVGAAYRGSVLLDRVSPR